MIQTSKLSYCYPGSASGTVIDRLIVTDTASAWKVREDYTAMDDIAKHEKIAAAYTEAARCLRSGKPDEVCEGALLQACKGVAIGKFCGMKH